MNSAEHEIVLPALQDCLQHLGDREAVTESRLPTENVNRLVGAPRQAVAQRCLRTRRAIGHDGDLTALGLGQLQCFLEGILVER